MKKFVEGFFIFPSQKRKMKAKEDGRRDEER
jgi:hypothetical protein